jgi:hypothetical protein
MYDNLLLLHILPMKTVAVYDLPAAVDGPRAHEIATAPPAFVATTGQPAGSEASSSGGAAQPKSTAVFVPPCHAVDISKAEAYRCGETAVLG